MSGSTTPPVHFDGGVDKRVRTDGDGLRVELSLPSGVWPSFMLPGAAWYRKGGLEWTLVLSPDAPLSLRVESGASETRLDLSGLKVTDLRVETGASSTEVVLPAAAGFTRAAGALSHIDVAPRFQRLASGQYESPDYATAPNKVDLKVETGVGAVTIR